MTKTQTFKITGMHCTSCAMNIDFDLEDLPGIKKADTNYAKEIAVVEYDPSQTTDKQILETIKKTGYQASIISE